MRSFLCAWVERAIFEISELQNSAEVAKGVVDIGGCSNGGLNAEDDRGPTIALGSNSSPKRMIP